MTDQLVVYLLTFTAVIGIPVLVIGLIYYNLTSEKKLLNTLKEEQKDSGWTIEYDTRYESRMFSLFSLGEDKYLTSDGNWISYSKYDKYYYPKHRYSFDSELHARLTLRAYLNKEEDD